MTEDTRTHEELLAEIDDLASQLAEANDEAATLRDENQCIANETDDAINAFLDELDRPCGSHKFTIPDNIRVHNAIRAMADAIGRNI